MKYMNHSVLALCVGLGCACDQKPATPEDSTPTAAEAPGEGLEHGLQEDVRKDSHLENAAMDDKKTDNSPETAEADLKAADGEKVEGDVEFEQRGDTVIVTAEVEDASPGKHGFHIHEKGDCSDIPGKSMGGHFNPENHDHMLPAEPGQRHLGDLGNIEIGQDGEGKLRFEVVGANLRPGDPKSLLGKAVVMHAGEDSGQAKQPSGAAGTPIACGVIERDI